MKSSNSDDDCQQQPFTIVNGFCMVPWAVVDARLSPHTLAVYVAIARHANESGQAWPSMDTIARVACMGTRKAREAVGELVKLGLISREFRKTASGDNDSTLYHVPRGTAYGAVPTAYGAPGVRHMVPGGTAYGAYKEEQTKNNQLEVDKEKTRRNAAAVEVPIPETLNTPEFLAAWQDWLSHRQEIRKPLKPTARKVQLEKLAAMGPSRAVAAIQHSLANGWLGIFEPKPERINGTATSRVGPNVVFDPNFKGGEGYGTF